MEAQKLLFKRNITYFNVNEKTTLTLMPCTAEEAFDTKGINLKYINEVPGIRYREILRLTGLTNGRLEYHLKVRESTVFRRDGRRAGYYPIDMPADESHILEHIRNIVARQIVIFILENDLCTFNKILKNISRRRLLLYHCTSRDYLKLV
jgi:predicted transcriptional regulator